MTPAGGNPQTRTPKTQVLGSARAPLEVRFLRPGALLQHVDEVHERVVLGVREAESDEHTHTQALLRVVLGPMSLHTVVQIRDNITIAPEYTQ